MSRFAQHTRLAAAPGKHDELVAKFLESAEIQRDNPDCELMLVSTAPDSADLVYLTEVWSSEGAWEHARRSAPIQAWAASMPVLVSGPPESIPLEVMGGKGIVEKTSMMPQLTKAPSVDVGLLVRRPPHDVFEALADPSITTRFWYTKSTGRMAEGAELTWEWDMYNASGKVWVQQVEAGRRIRFSWEGYDPSHPTTVEFQFILYQNDATYLRITETGFTGDADTQVSRALESTAGFTFLLSSLKAALEHDITLRVIMDAHPPNLQMPPH